jgi:hypothetical protein
MVALGACKIMIYEKRPSRGHLLEIGMISVFMTDGIFTHHILYDIFDNGEEFVEIWVPYNKVTHG